MSYHPHILRASTNPIQALQHLSLRTSTNSFHAFQALSSSMLCQRLAIVSEVILRCFFCLITEAHCSKAAAGAKDAGARKFIAHEWGRSKGADSTKGGRSEGWNSTRGVGRRWGTASGHVAHSKGSGD